MDKIVITMNVIDEYLDEDHPMGVTNEGYELIVDRLASIGDDIEVTRG